MKKILMIFGTRPEAIKMAPLYLALKAQSDIQVEVCVTAQHRQMLDQVLDIFHIQPEYDLDVMRVGQSLYDVTSQVLIGLAPVLRAAAPDISLVHGDTTTSFAAALASFYAGIPVGHIEAGLRTGNLMAPWPEEANRRLTGVLTALHFAPTSRAAENLKRENVSAGSIFVTGNTVIDALFHVRARIIGDPENLRRNQERLAAEGYSITTREARRIILVTGHRRENFGQGFIQICQALKQLALRHPEVDIVYPVHFNPNVQKPVNELLSGIGNIFLIAPLDYEPFIYLMDRSYLILTDSGGVQEEAPSLGKPVLVMRDTTERPEAVEAGTVTLVGTDCRKILEETTKLLQDTAAYQQMALAHNPYGDGRACERIIKVLRE